MDFNFTEEQSMLRDTVASYLADHYDFEKRRTAVAADPDLTRARLGLVRAVAIVVASGLAVFGVQPVEEM